MDLSVVIVNWNTRDFLRDCLISLEPYVAHSVSQSQAAGPSPRGAPLRTAPPAPIGSGHAGGGRGETGLSVEVIVVDNASTDGSAELVAAQFPWCRIVANAENAGWARGNNQGIELSSGRAILLLNPDTVVPPDSLEAMMECLDRHPDAAAVGARLVGPDGRVQASCRGFPHPASLLYEASGLARLFPHSRLLAAYRMSWFGYGHEAEVDQPMGSALLLRRSAVEVVGMIDEVFPIFFNDVDWCFRARAAGWKVWFCPSATIRHFGGASTRQVRPRMIRESHRSLCRFLRKHYAGRMGAVPLAAAILSVRLGELLRLAACSLQAMRKTDGRGRGEASS